MFPNHRLTSATVTEESSAKLKILTELLGTYTSIDVVIEGHASADGSKAYNQSLSEKRAESVKESLVAMGVEASRLETVGYGETRPSEDNSSASGREANRRVNIDRKVQLRVVE